MQIVIEVWKGVTLNRLLALFHNVLRMKGVFSVRCIISKHFKIRLPVATEKFRAQRLRVLFLQKVELF